MGKYEMINLEELFNNKGISRMNNPQDANFTGFGSSYISENLQSSRSVLELYGVPFLFPNKDPLVVDNLEFMNQEIQIKEAYYSNIHVLGAADNGSFIEPIKLVGNDIKEVKIGLTDWIESSPKFNNKKGIICEGINSNKSGYTRTVKTNIWYSVVGIPSNSLFKSILLVDNPSMHIFSLTLEKDGCL